MAEPNTHEEIADQNLTLHRIGIEDTEGRVSKCCKSEIIFYDWYRCGKCGEFIHNVQKDSLDTCLLPPHGA
jgi:hypothetical protein